MVGVTLGALRSMGLDDCVMPGVHPCGSYRASLTYTSPRALCPRLVPPSSLIHLLSLVLSLPDLQPHGMWPSQAGFSHSGIASKVLHVFAWPGGSFLFSPYQCPV